MSDYLMFGSEFMFLRASLWIKFRYIFERARDSLYVFGARRFWYCDVYILKKIKFEQLWNSRRSIVWEHLDYEPEMWLDDQLKLILSMFYFMKYRSIACLWVCKLDYAR